MGRRLPASWSTYTDILLFSEYVQCWASCQRKSWDPVYSFLASVFWCSIQADVAGEAQFTMKSWLCSQIINILSSASTRQKILRRSLTFVVQYLCPTKTDSFPHSFHKCWLSKYFVLGSVPETHGTEEVRSHTWCTTIRAHGNLPMASSKPRCWRSSCVGMRHIWV